MKVIISLKHLIVRYNEPVTGAHQNHSHHARELHPQHLDNLQTAKINHLLETNTQKGKKKAECYTNYVAPNSPLQMHSQGALVEPLGQCELCVHTTKIKFTR
jgi:hypothetical protein